MSNSNIKLILTDIGRKRIDTLVKSKSDISLEIAIGNGTIPPSKESTSLSQECARIEPSMVSDDNKGNWHINANFPIGDDSFDITELGLFIDDKKKKNFSLLGIYYQKTAFAKKTSNSDLLIDIVVNITDLSQEPIQLEDYNPKFSIPQATQATYGAVRLAKADDVASENPGLAIMTDNLTELSQKIVEKIPQATEEHYGTVQFATKAAIQTHTPGFVLSTANLADIQAAAAATVPMVEIVKTQTLNADGLFAPMGFLFVPNAIYSLMLLNKEGLGKNLIVIKYDIENNTLSENPVFESTGGRFVYSLSPSAGLKKDKIRWLVFKDPAISDNYAWYLETSMNMLELLTVGSKHFSFSSTGAGSLAYYNDCACVLGSSTQYSKQLLFAVDNEINITYSLAYDRKKPLVHIVQGKMYCLGGNRLGEPLVEIHSIGTEENKLLLERSSFRADNLKKLTKHFPFTPPNTSILDLSDTTGWTSCVLGSRIYLFQANTYYKGNNAVFHFYDCQSNIWHTSHFSENAFNRIESAFAYAEAVSDGKAIYLFATTDASTKTKLTIIKLTPW
jgi:hypothetical protein